MKKPSTNFPNKLIVLSVGIVCGIAVTATVLSFAYKTYRHVKQPKRYDTQSLIAQLQGPTITRNLKIFSASSLDRIFRDGKTLLKPAFATTVSLSAAANEYESFQIIIHPRKPLKSVKLELSDLKTTDGIQIAKNNITPYLVGYVPTKEPYYKVKFVGLWPDPLLPFKAFNVEAGQFQPVWVNIYVPNNTPAGDYKGSLTVRADGISDQTIPVSLHVYGFALPVESHLKTAFDFYGHLTKERYPQGEKESDSAWQARINEINDKFLIEMLKHRMNPVLNVDPTSQAELGSIDRYRVYGINNFSIGRRGGTFNNNWPTDDESINAMEGLYRTYAEMLRLNGMLQYTYIYTWDEGEIGNPIVQKVTAMIHRAFLGLKNMVCYHGFWDPDVLPGWGRDIDIWCFNIDDFKEEAMRKLQKVGIEMWVYVSGPSDTGAPNLGMDFDSIDYRITPWLCWKYNIKGFLYWCVNWWEGMDPFKTAANTKWAQNGNGLLFYPGEGGPLPSVRTEVFRDGMEDYEYIQTLIKRIKEIKVLKLGDRFQKQIDESIKLMTVDGSIASSMFEFTKDSETIQKRRDAIAKKVEEFDRLLMQARLPTEPQPEKTADAPAPAE
jgi:hypothetical protein